MKTTLLITLFFLTLSFNSILSQECIDIPNLPTTQINSNINDDVNYPVGTPYWSEGNIDFIKLPGTLPWNHQPGDTTMCTSNGNVVLSVANANNPKTLFISLIYEHGLIVDGDTIFDSANPPASYTGSTFDLTYTQDFGLSEFTIEGDFDTVEVLANNLCIYEICLEEGLVVENCVDIPTLPTTQINSNINDDVNYPVGTPYWSEGNIDFIKLPNTLPWNHQPGDTTICTSNGNVMFSVANANNPKTLNISMVYENGLIVDGDTIFDSANPPASYTGSTFELTYTQDVGLSEYTIEGDFDTVEILANNLCIHEICLEESVLDVIENSITENTEPIVYPNPTQLNQLIVVKNNFTIEKLRITNINGQVVYNETKDSKQINLTLDHHFQNGMYLVSLFTEGRWVHKKLLVR